METENKKILLVEDDPNFGTVLKDYLAMNDYEVTHAKNGMEGFEKFKKDDFDLCILDVMMPGEDGLSLCRHLRESHNMPVILLTAMAEDADRIIEVFAMEFHPDGRPTGREFYALVDPERSIPSDSTAVHGRTDADVAGMPKFKEVAHQLMSFMEGAECIAHNGRSFDEPFINSELIRAGLPYTFWEKPAKCTDTMALSRQIWPRQKATLVIHRNGKSENVPVTIRIDTPIEVDGRLFVFYGMADSKIGVALLERTDAG